MKSASKEIDKLSFNYTVETFIGILHLPGNLKQSASPCGNCTSGIVVIRRVSSPMRYICIALSRISKEAHFAAIFHG